MGVKDIAFPNLNIYLENVPKRFELFGIEVALYGVIIGIGMLLSLCLIAYVAKKSGQNADFYWDMAITTVITGVIGARLYYVIFSWDSYKNDLLSIFNLRQGGLAIYGGILGGLAAIMIFTKIKKYRLTLALDTVVPGVILGQILGRWGNFFNREAFGDYTDGLFAMRLPVDAVRYSEITSKMIEHMEEGANYIQVHPTFLYESLWNIGILALMLLLWRKKHFDGEVTLLYFAGYGIGRFFIESLRTDQLQLGNTGIAVSQMLGLVLFLTAVVIESVVLVRIYGKKKKK
ncbi:MAG: prolipoprotein diacylglyceryl transferase [Lachnospiraceae bacterium]|nr:prolipoprotein diacylglyceryl transferase [Lachnospiraceae bacterium]